MVQENLVSAKVAIQLQALGFDSECWIISEDSSTQFPTELYALLWLLSQYETLKEDTNEYVTYKMFTDTSCRIYLGKEEIKSCDNVEEAIDWLIIELVNGKKG